MIASNAFFVATEFSLTRLARVKEPEEGLERVAQMVEELEIYLTGCQVGITFSSVLLGVVAEPAVSELVHRMVGSDLPHAAWISVAISVLIINLSHTIWAEQTPTYLGVERARLVGRWLATPLYYWTRLVYPLIWVGDHMAKASLRIFGVTMERSWTEEGDAQKKPRNRVELAEQIGRLLKERELDFEHRHEVLAALDFDQVSTGEIMRPSQAIVSLSCSQSFEQSLDIIAEHTHSRYPLFDDSRYIGIIYSAEILRNLKPLLNEQIHLREIAREPLLVGSEVTASRLVDTMQEHNQEMALVGTSDEIEGLVTLTDTYEYIVGEMEDPLDLDMKE